MSAALYLLGQAEAKANLWAARADEAHARALTAEARLAAVLAWYERAADSGGQGGSAPPPLHELRAAATGETP